MIDHDRINDKIREGKSYCNEIKEIYPSSFQEFKDNLLLIRSGERLFEIIAQVMLDICTYVVSNLPVKTPKSYANCIDSLVENDILPKKEQNDFVNIIKMRNLVAHRYGEIDLKILYDSLGVICDDYKKFSNHILTWVQTETKFKTEHGE